MRTKNNKKTKEYKVLTENKCPNCGNTVVKTFREQVEVLRRGERFQTFVCDCGWQQKVESHLVDSQFDE